MMSTCRRHDGGAPRYIVPLCGFHTQRIQDGGVPVYSLTQRNGLSSTDRMRPMALVIVSFRMILMVRADFAAFIAPSCFNHQRRTGQARPTRSIQRGGRYAKRTQPTKMQPKVKKQATHTIPSMNLGWLCTM